MTLTAREKFGIALGVVGVLMFGGTLPATRVAVATFDPLFLSAARATIAGCLGAILLLVLRRPMPPRALWLELALTGVCTIIGFPAAMALAMAHVPASHGGVVLGIMPLATVAAASLVAHERPSARFWLASAGGAAIVLLFILRRTGFEGVAVGDLYLLATIAFGAFGYALSGRLSRQMPGWEVISWQVALFLPLSFLATILLWRPLPVVPVPAWAALAYVSLISMFLAFFVFNAAMAMGGVARIGQLMLLQPFVIVALSVPVNGERFDVTTILYAAAVVAAVIIGQRTNVRRHQPK